MREVSIERGPPRPNSPLIPLACPLLDVEQLELTIPRLVRSVSKTTPTITLLLQDVDQLATEAQPTLHRLLAAHRAVLRTLSTARQSLIRLAQSSRFHEDLAATLETIGIELPALAARLGDLPLLVQSFVEEINASGGRQSGGFFARIAGAVFLADAAIGPEVARPQ